MSTDTKALTKKDARYLNISSLPPAVSGRGADSRSANSESERELVIDPHYKAHNPFKWRELWPFPVVSLLYATHRLYRRHRPRRFPRLTPLGLPGIYLTLATAAYGTYYSLASYSEVVKDRDLLIIGPIAGALASHSGQQKSTQEAVAQQMATEDPDLKRHLLYLSECRWSGYTSSGPFGKLLWLHQHIWSNQSWWSAWALIMLAASHQDGGTPMLVSDHDIIVTYLANRSSGWKEKANYAACVGFAASVPMGMLARWSRRRLLYLPMNGLQRLAIFAWVYTDPLRECEDWRRLKLIQNKETIARWIVATFDNVDFDEEVGKVQRDPWSIL